MKRAARLVGALLCAAGLPLAAGAFPHDQVDYCKYDPPPCASVTLDPQPVALRVWLDAANKLIKVDDKEIWLFYPGQPNQVRWHFDYTGTDYRLHVCASNYASTSHFAQRHWKLMPNEQCLSGRTQRGGRWDYKLWLTDKDGKEVEGWKVDPSIIINMGPLPPLGHVKYQGFWNVE